jgi:hypothetical protein
MARRFYLVALLIDVVVSNSFVQREFKTKGSKLP